MNNFKNMSFRVFSGVFSDLFGCLFGSLSVFLGLRGCLFEYFVVFSCVLLDLFGPFWVFSVYISASKQLGYLCHLGVRHLELLKPFYTVLESHIVEVHDNIAKLRDEHRFFLDHFSPPIVRFVTRIYYQYREN